MSSQDIHEVAEKIQYIRRGEGIVYKLTTTNWESSPVASDIVITRLSDSTDVTDDWTTTATPTVASDVITLPEITVPADAQTGKYQVDIPFTAGGFSPGKPYLRLLVS